VVESIPDKAPHFARGSTAGYPSTPDQPVEADPGLKLADFIARETSVRTLLGRYLTTWGMHAMKFRMSAFASSCPSGNHLTSLRQAGAQPQRGNHQLLAVEWRKVAGNSSLPLIFHYREFASRPFQQYNIVPKPIKPLLLRKRGLSAGTGRLEVRRETRVSKLDRALAERMPLRVLWLTTIH